MGDPVPVPPADPDPYTQPDDARLWIGNLDTKITEYSLLKILQKYGTLKKFDFLYHKSGPDQGKPRGYCFVTYSSQQEAEQAMKSLQGKKALSKRLIVKPAHADLAQSDPAPKTSSHIPALGNPGSSNKDQASTEAKIRAIEAKLRKMEEGKDDPPASIHPALAIANPSSSSSSSRSSSSSWRQQSRGHHSHKPYSKRSSFR